MQGNIRQFGIILAAAVLGGVAPAAADVVASSENRLSENLVAAPQGLGLAYTDSGDPAKKLRHSGDMAALAR
jgi:hypothetical protein